MKSGNPSPGSSSLAKALERLGTGPNYRLALLIAPACYGKTRLLRQWAQSRQDAWIVWVGLEPSDDVPQSFYQAIKKAFQNFDPQGERFSLPGNNETGIFNLEERAIDLINALAEAPGDFYLVLDDYHVIHTPQIHAAVGMLLDYQPPQMHLIIASRGEPPLPLPRLRVRRQLIELGPDELRASLE